MRLATIRTSRGFRLHVAGAGGYVDVADATGDPELAGLAHVLAAGQPALDAIRPVASREGRRREARRRDFVVDRLSCRARTGRP